MTSLASLKAFLYETRGQSGERDRQLDYQLFGHHATLTPRDFSLSKGKNSLSIGRKIDLPKDVMVNKKKEFLKKKSKPVIVPECREETEHSESGLKDGSQYSPSPALMRENTDDVPLTDELLKNDTSNPTGCTDCSNIGLYSRLYNRNHVKNCNVEFLNEKRQSINRKKTKQEKEVLMSIVYPHDFYDRYQSVRRSLNTPTDDGERKKESKKKSTVTQKVIQPKTNPVLPETINEGDRTVLKPHVVKFKEKSEQSADTKEVGRNKNENNVKVVSPNNTLPPIQPEVQSMKPKHLRCQPLPKAYFMAAVSPRKFLTDSRYSFFDHQRQFRGFMVSKSDKNEKPKVAEIKPLISVGSLGLSVGIPEYNVKLANRQTSTNSFLTKTFSSLTNVNRPQSLNPKTKLRPPGSIGHRSM